MSLQTPLKNSAEKTTAHELKNILDNDQSVALIDVRTTGEFRSGHIAQAINIPMDDIESRLEDIPKRDHTIFICQSGVRADMAKDSLSSKLDNVVCLEGGMDAWISNDQKIVRATRAKMALDRQSLIVASIIILTSVALGTFVNPAWYFLALLPGVGLMLAGSVGFCLMGIILATMPWNKSRSHS